MQAFHKTELRKQALLPMFSRYGRETKNYHHEFMKAQSQEKQSKLGHTQRVKPKIETNLNQNDPDRQAKQRRGVGSSDAVSQMVKLNMQTLMQNQNFQEFSADIISGAGADYVTDK